MIHPPQGTIATDVADSSIATGDIQDDAVTADKIAPSAAGTVKLADSAVTTGKIADSAVAPRKIFIPNDSQVNIGDPADSAGFLLHGTVGAGNGLVIGVGGQRVIRLPIGANAGRVRFIGANNVRFDQPVDFRSGVDLHDNTLEGIRSSPSAVAAADLSAGELIFDEPSGGIAFKDQVGSAWFVKASALA